MKRLKRLVVIFVSILAIFPLAGFSAELSQRSLKATLRCDACVRTGGWVTLADLLEYIKFLSPDVKAVESNEKVLITFGKSKLMLLRLDMSEATPTADGESWLMPQSYMEDGVFMDAVASKEFSIQKIELILNEAEMRMMEQGVEFPGAKRNRLHEAELLERQKQEQSQGKQEQEKHTAERANLLERIRNYQVWAVRGVNSLQSTGLTFGEICNAVKRLHPNAEPEVRNTDVKMLLISLGGEYFTAVENIQQNRLEINSAEASQFIWLLVERQ